MKMKLEDELKAEVAAMGMDLNFLDILEDNLPLH